MFVEVLRVHPTDVGTRKHVTTFPGLGEAESPGDKPLGTPLALTWGQLVGVPAGLAGKVPRQQKSWETKAAPILRLGQRARETGAAPQAGTGAATPEMPVCSWCSGPCSGLVLAPPGAISSTSSSLAPSD